VLCRADGAVLLVRRPARGLLAGMWTFPGKEIGPADDAAEAVREVAASHGTVLSPPRHVGDVEHTFSHRRERYLCHELSIEPASQPGSAGTVWVGADRSALALSRAQQRVHALAFADAATPSGA
jgi:adenine-specific DNA glycosylase